MIQVKKSKSKIFGEFARLGQILDKIPVDLVPFTQNELNLISFHQEMKKTSGWVNRMTTGVITTIYQEYLAQYIFKSFFFTSITAILFVRTSNYDIGYVFGKKSCELYINEQYVGQINERGELIGPKRRKILLEADRQFDNTIMLNILGREAALINSFNEGDLSFSRMLAWEDSKTIEEQLLILVMCILRNIVMAIPHPVIKSFFRT